MSMIRIRLIGTHDDANSLITVLHGVDGIEHVEEIDDLMPMMRDDSSSSEVAGATPTSATSAYVIEVEAPDDMHADAVREVAEVHAASLDAGIEFINDF